MAKITNNQLLHGVSGMIGDNFVIKNGPTTQYMANKPTRRKKSSEAQLLQNRRLSMANKYGKEQIKNGERKALYEKGTKFSAYHSAVSDFLVPPVIASIEADAYTGQPGEIIRIRATDDFRVATVTVSLERTDGTVIEKGNAVPRGKRGLWRMPTTTRNEVVKGTVINVEATDHAGNRTRERLVL